jgi:hypothetical protein
MLFENRSAAYSKRVPRSSLALKLIAEHTEIALHSDGTLDGTKYWFNVDQFEKYPAKIPTSFQTGAFLF